MSAGGVMAFAVFFAGFLGVAVAYAVDVDTGFYAGASAFVFALYLSWLAESS